MWFWQEKALWATQNCLSCELQANQLLRPRGSESDAASHAARMSPCQLVWLKLATAPAQALVPDEVCELLHPKPPHNWSYKNPSRFELAGSSNGGFHCNQRGFQPFFWLKWLAKIQGLALFFFSPLFSFPVWLVGRGMPGWSQSWWWCGLFLPWEAMKSHFPPHTRNQRAGKAPLAQRAKCRFPTSPWPQKLPFGVSQFLCLFWPRPLVLAAAPRLRVCSRRSSYRHVHQTLTIFSTIGWSSRSCQRRSPQTNPSSVLRKPLSTVRRFTHWQQMSTRKTNRAALLAVYRLSRPAGPGVSHLLVPG